MAEQSQARCPNLHTHSPHHVHCFAAARAGAPPLCRSQQCSHHHVPAAMQELTQPYGEVCKRLGTARMAKAASTSQIVWAKVGQFPYWPVSAVITVCCSLPPCLPFVPATHAPKPLGKTP